MAVIDEPRYLVTDLGWRRHINRDPELVWPFCGVRNTTSNLMGVEPDLPVCKRCQHAWDKRQQAAQ